MWGVKNKLIFLKIFLLCIVFLEVHIKSGDKSQSLPITCNSPNIFSIYLYTRILQYENVNMI